jgi:hypothetical protein
MNNIQYNMNLQQILIPRIQESTRVYLAEKASVQFGNYIDESQRKMNNSIKQECVHMVFEGNDLANKVGRVGDELKCDACGRTIYSKFDGSNVDILVKAIEVLDQMVYFGIPCNFPPDMVKALLFCKKVFPAFAQTLKAFNAYVARDTSAMDSVRNIGAEYDINRFRNITGMR